MTRLLRTILSLVLLADTIRGENLENGYNLVNGAQKVPAFSYAKEFQGDSLIPISQLLEDSHTGVIARAEQMLRDGLMTDSPDYNVTNTCLNHTEDFIQALVERQPWAFRSMLNFNLSIENHRYLTGLKVNFTACANKEFDDQSAYPRRLISFFPFRKQPMNTGESIKK